MKRPLSISIGRVVLPSGFRDQERAFIEALTGAVGGRAQGHAMHGAAGDEIGRAATRTADAIADRTGKHWADG